MRFVIRKSGEHLGELSFDGGIHDFNGQQEFGVKLANVIRSGVSLMQDIVFDDKRWMIDEPITSSDIRFPIAVVEHLRRRGFTVEEIHPEIEERFKKILSAVPDDTPLHQSLSQWWSKMSYLQKTDFLDILRVELTK